MESSSVGEGRSGDPNRGRKSAVAASLVRLTFYFRQALVSYDFASIEHCVKMQGRVV